MQSYSGVALVVKSFLFAVCATALFGVANVGAQDSQVEVMVCPTTDASRLTVLQPQTDSVIDGSKVAVMGEVEFISQIDFFINDTYNHTIALGAADTSFESMVTLPPGTNTLKLVATARCSLSDRTQNIVLTYQPDTPPSIGKNVPTVVDDRVLDSVLLPEEAPEKSPIQNVYDNWVVAPIITVGESLDIVDASPDQNSDALPDAARTVGFVAGVAMLSIVVAFQFGGIATALAKYTFLSRHFALIGVAGLVVLAIVFIV
jgi:hypothetical protein